MPNTRITQEPVRVLVLPTDTKERVTQEPVRVLIRPTDTKERVTQLAVRVLRSSAGPYDAAVLATSGLVSYWPLNEPGSTTAVDNKGANNGIYNGTFFLNQQALSAYTDKCAQFDGSTGYAQIPTASSLHPTAAVTVEAWVCPLTLNSNYRHIAGCNFSANVNPYDDYKIGIDNTNHFIFNCQTSGGGVQLASPGVPQLYVFYHVVGTYDGTTSRLYVNGVQVASSALTGTVNNSNQTFNIGRTNRGPFQGEYFPGYISSVALYNTALSAATVLAHYNTALYANTLLLDGLVTANPTGGSSQPIILTTTKANDVIVVAVFQEGNSLSTAPTVSTISGGGLAWARRKALTLPSIAGNPVGQLEIWSAPAASPLSAVTITITLTGTTDSWSIVAFGVNGAVNPAAPWDNNASLPATAVSFGSTNPAATISTTQTNDLVLAFYCNVSNAGYGSTPANFTLIGWGEVHNGWYASGAVAFYSVPAPQVSTTVTWLYNQGAMIVDALTVTSPIISSGNPAFMLAQF